MLSRPFCVASLLAVLAVPTISVAKDQPAASDDIFTREKIVELARKVRDYQLEHPWKKVDPNWVRATYYTGVMGLYRLTEDPEILQQAIDWGNKHGWRAGTESAPANKMTCGQTWLELYQIKQDPKMLGPIKAYVDGQIEHGDHPRKGWYYCDTLYVGPPTIALLGKITGEQKYWDYLDFVWWDTSDRLYDEDDDLYYRDKAYIGKKTKRGKKIFWSRGSGWVIGGLARVLQLIPEDHPTRPRYVKQFKDMAAALKKCQGEDGCWRSNLGDAEHHPNPETSGTAFFCYALAWGINEGILPRDEYIPVVKKAWVGLVSHVNDEGRLGYVQPIGHDPQPAAEHQTQEYAQGLFLLSAEEMAKLADKGWL